MWQRNRGAAIELHQLNTNDIAFVMEWEMTNGYFVLFRTHRRATHQIQSLTLDDFSSFISVFGRQLPKYLPAFQQTYNNRLLFLLVPSSGPIGCPPSLPSLSFFFVVSCFVFVFLFSLRFKTISEYVLILCVFFHKNER